MSKTLMLVVALGAAAVAMKTCSVGETRNVPFTGSWVLRESSEVTGRTRVVNYEVTTDGRRFRITSTSTDPEWGSTTDGVMVYDGERIHTRTEVTGRDGSQDDLDIEAEAATRPALNNARFWKTVELAGAEAGAGGRIAGRDTLLYQSKVNRPDGTAVTQAWLDAETSTVLKSVFSLYAKQVESELMRQEYECTAISFGAVDDADFAKPS